MYSLKEELTKDSDDIESIKSGVDYLLYGIGSWLALMTILSTTIFIIANLRLNKAFKALDEMDASPAAPTKSKMKPARTKTPLSSIRIRKLRRSVHPGNKV